MAVPEAVCPLLDGLVDLVRDRFTERLDGVYLLGSLAHGGWSQRLSDVDACVILRDPLAEGDGPGLVAVTGELAERFPRFGPRLSLFWATPAILEGAASGGRLGSIDAADLVQNGQLLWGADLRGRLRPASREQLVDAMYADMIERWQQRISPFAGREALEAGRGAGLGERSLLKACLYPPRFLYTGETGRVAGNDEAVEHYVERYGDGVNSEALRLARDIRNREQGPETTRAECERLAAGFRPLYAQFFGEIERLYGLEPPRS